MKPLFAAKTLTSLVTATALVLGTATVSTVALAPDVAFAKSDKGNGNGNEGGRGGGKDKSDRGNGKDKADRGNSNKAKSNGNGNGNRTASAKGKNDLSGAWRDLKNNFKGNGKSKTKSNNGNGPKTLADAGRQFRNDVRSLFSGQTTNSGPKKTYKPVKRVTLVDTSPRPTARVTRVSAPTDLDTTKPKKGVRDPLVAAVTSPDGSDKLRNLSASGAAAAAFANASPNSNVGKIATYQDAAAEYYDLRDELTEARSELRDFDEMYDGRSSQEINDEIAGLDPSAPDYSDTLAGLEEELAAAETYETEREALTDDLKDLRSETYAALEEAEAAFFDASKGREVTRDVLGDFHQNLGLPEPTEPKDGYVEYDPNKKDDVTIQPVSVIDETIEPPSLWNARKDRPRRDPLLAAITDPDGSDKLRNLNASNAAAAAFANASPNSNVGKIATYQAEAEEYYALRDELFEARTDLGDFNDAYDGRSSEEILDEIAALDPTLPGYEETLAGLEEELSDADAFEDARDDLLDDFRDLRRAVLIAAKEAEAAFYEASKGSTLTVATLDDFHENLGLPTSDRQ